MTAFLSTFNNRIDAKGRVSVPASFRALLSAQRSSGIILYPSLKLPCLEGSGDERMAEIVDSIDALDAFSEERDALETILSDACHLNIDSDGRIILPSDFIEFAGLNGSVIFAGRGKGFQIWEPAAFEAHQKASRERARNRGATLRIVGRTNGSGK